LLEASVRATLSYYPNLNDFNGQQATPSSVPLMQSAQNACPSSHSWTLAVKSIFNEIHSG